MANDTESNDTPRIVTLRIPKTLRERIKREAANEGLPVSEFVSRHMERLLDEREPAVPYEL